VGLGRAGGSSFHLAGASFFLPFSLLTSHREGDGLPCIAPTHAQKYYSEASGLLFLLDAADEKRLEEACSAFRMRAHPSTLSSSFPSLTRGSSIACVCVCVCVCV
jgi:hypothetical protein